VILSNKKREAAGISVPAVLKWEKPKIPNFFSKKFDQGIFKLS